MMICCLTAMFITSCLGNDDDNNKQITPAEAKACMQTMRTNTSMKAALLNAVQQPLICEVGITNTSPIEFLVNPRPMKFKLNYDGEDHEIAIVYYVNSIRSFGIYNRDRDILEIMVCIGGIYVDDKLVYNLSSGVNNLFSSSSHTK